MRFRLPNKIQSVFKNSCLFLLGLSCILFTGCQYWYRDMKGYLEYWSGTVQVGNVSYSASPQIQKNSSGVDTVSSNATITASVDIINPEGYLLDGGVGSAADALRSVRISGESGSAALSRTTVTSSSNTRMDIEIAPLSMVPTPESLKLEHTDFTLTFTPTRSENGVSAAETKTVTLRYNTPPRMPLEVVYNQDTQQLDWMGVEKWELVQGTSSALDDLIFWAYPSGISSSTHPDHVVKFEVYEDDVLFDEYTPEECLMSGQSNLQPHVPQDLKDAGYNIYYSLATSGKEVTIYAVDSEGVRSLAATSGKAPYAITLNANGGSFGTSNTVTVYRADGSHLNGGDLDIPTKDGYYLSGWTENGNPVTFPYTVSAPVTLTAQWTPNPVSGGGSDGGDSDGGTDGGDGGVVTPSTYTVTFDAAGGKFADGKNIMTETVQSGTAVSQPSSPTRDGWVFTWWKDPKTGSAYDFSKPVTGSFTLTANWTQEFYVNPTSGDDTNLGTQDKPLATIQAAVGKINDLNDGSSAYTILLMGNVTDSSSGAYDSGNNKSLVNIAPTKALNLTLKSNSDGTKRTINAGRTDTNTGRVLYVGANATVTLQDLIVTGGYSDDLGGGIHIIGGTVTLNNIEVTDNASKNAGGGIYLNNSSSSTTLTLTDSTVSNNESTQSSGGGIHIESGTAEITNSEIIGNKAQGTSSGGNGGGICCGGTLSLDGNTKVTGNTAANGGGGGILVGQGGSVTIETGSTVSISGNEATDGGGVYVSGGTFNAYGGTIGGDSNDKGNTASDMGGGVFIHNGNFTMETGSSIRGNTASSQSGGVFINSGTFTMNGGTISGNTTSGNGGGVFVKDTSSTFTMNGGVIGGDGDADKNIAQNGGGVYSTGNFEMTNGTISFNSASVDGGGVHVAAGVTFNMTSINSSIPQITNNSAQNGGGVYVSEGTFEMNGGEISENKATNGNGGGVYVAANCTFTAKSGTIGGADTKKNTATNGGGVYVAGADTTANPGKLVLEGATISYNEADTSGGGVANYGTLEMSSGSIANNTAGHNGGGINNAGTLTMTGGSIGDNEATTAGGGVYVSADSTFTMTSGITAPKIIGNEAGGNGGGVYAGGTLNMNGGEISGNTATYNGGGIAVDGGVNSNIKASIAGGAIGVSGSPNTAENGGGIYLISGMVDISAADVSYNKATSKGGGICLLDGSVTLQGGAVSNNEANSGGGVHVITGTTLEMTGGVISNNAATGNGGGVNLSGTLTMTGGSIEYNTAASDGGGVYIATNASLSIIGTSSPRIAYNSAKNGGGVYIVNMGILGMGSGSISGNTATQEGAGVYDNGMVSLGGSASISSTNVFYLSGAADSISITSTLTESSVASIYVSGAMAGKQVLQAGQGSNVTLANEVSKFTILPDGTGYWSIDTNGQLVKQSTQDVVLPAIQNGSSSELFLFDDATSTDNLRAIFEALRDNSSGYFTLDLSRTTLTSFSVDGVVLADWNGVASLKKIIFPATLTSIDLSSNNPFSGIYYENLIVVFRDTTSSWTSDSGSEFEPKVDGSVDSSHFVSGSPRWTKK